MNTVISTSESTTSFDAANLVARVLLMTLMLVSGWHKFTSYSETVELMKHFNLPFPQLATIIATATELGLGTMLLLGYQTRPIALYMALYCLITALIAHRYWEMTGEASMCAEMNFYKNLSIMGGLLLLAAIGPGRYSIDDRLRATKS